VRVVGTGPREEDVSGSAKLPVRYWRWMWLGEALRLLSIPFLIVLVPVYFTAQGIVWALDKAGDKVYVLRMAFYISDRRRSCWNPPLPPRQRIELSDEWKDKIR
jgi:hypothetical protein